MKIHFLNTMNILSYLNLDENMRDLVIGKSFQLTQALFSTFKDTLYPSFGEKGRKYSFCNFLVKLYFIIHTTF